MAARDYKEGLRHFS